MLIRLLFKNYKCKNL